MTGRVLLVGVAGSTLCFQRHVAGVVRSRVFGSHCTSVADEEDVRNLLS